MRTYRQLFAVREFRVLFGLRCLVMASVSMSGLALGTVTYAATGSTLLTALAMFGGPLVTLLGSATVLGASDSLTPRIGVLLPLAAATVVDLFQAAPGLAWPVRFVLLAVPYLVMAATSGATNRMLALVVPDGGFVLGRATLNIAVGVMQVVGYGLGGLLLTALSATDLFLVAAVASAVGVAVARLGLGAYPATQSHRGLVARTRRVNRDQLGSPVLRPVYLSLWIPNGLVVGCEALFVPFGGSSGAGYLFAATAAGMLLGDITVGRCLPPAWQARALTPLRVLLAAPYLLLLTDPPLAMVIAAGFVASIGYSASLPLQERVHRLADPAVRGQAFGLAGSGMMIGQAVGATLAGAVAEVLPVHLTMGLLAAASLGVTLALTSALQRSAPSSTLTEAGPDSAVHRDSSSDAAHTHSPQDR